MRLDDLLAVHRAIEGLDDEESILRLASTAASIEAGGWFARARAIGELQRRAHYSTSAVTRYAKELQVSRSLAFELGAIDRKILLPRLKERGDKAQFPIRERLMYATACKLAPELKRPALAILAVAEEQRRTNPRFSARSLRLHFGVKSPARESGMSIDRCLARIGKLNRTQRSQFVRSLTDPVEVMRLAEAAAKNSAALAQELRARMGES